jgi:hypothetical protein
LRLDIDSKAGDLNVSIRLAGKPGSPLAAEITDLGNVKSLVTGLLDPDGAMSIAAAVALPEKPRKALEPVLEEELKKDLSKTKDGPYRETLERLIRALMPTLKSAQLDGGTVLRGPTADGTYTQLAAVRLRNGKQLEKELREGIKTLEPEAKVTFDLEKLGDVGIHRLERKEDAGFRRLFGDRPFYFAIRDDAAFAATGAKALDALKEALAAMPKPGKLLQADFSLAQMAPGLSVSYPAVSEAAKKAFVGGKDTDKIRVTLEGGSTLQLKLSVKAALITFFSELDKARPKGE